MLSGNESLETKEEKIVVVVKDCYHFYGIYADEFKDKNIDFYCDCDKIVGNIIIRAKQAGDRIKPAGRNVSKTLKKLLNESAYPIEKRDKKIVVCDDLGIVGVIGLCADERVKVDCNTAKILTIKLPSEDLFNE